MKHLSLVVLLCVAGCSSDPTDKQREFALAMDSAYQTVWTGKTIPSARSVDFDSAYHFFTLSARIESLRRKSSDSLAKSNVLGIEALSSPAARARSRVTIARSIARDSNLKLQLAWVRTQFRTWAWIALERIYKDDTGSIEVELSALTRKEYFEPRWREQFDSIENVVKNRYLAIIEHIDTTDRRVKFEGSIRFADPRDMSSYMQLRNELDSLAHVEQEILAHGSPTQSPLKASSAQPPGEQPPGEQSPGDQHSQQQTQSEQGRPRLP